MGAWFVKLSQTSAVGHLLAGSPQPVDRLSGHCVHGSSIPAIGAAVKQGPGNQGQSSYRNGRMIENPAHMIIVSGIPTRMKSENL